MKALVRRAGFAGILVPIVLLSLVPTHAQQVASRRKLLVRVAPAYPNLARSMALEGVVKVDALVAPDGSVRSLEVKGGHPVLTQAAVNAVRQWKWEPAASESHEQLEIRFSPPD
jgi:TonB family protein